MADPPTIDVIQAVYVVPSDKTSVMGQASAIAHEIVVVQSWFDTQTGGTHPVFARDGNSISVATVNLSGSLEAIDTDTRIVVEIREALPAAENQPLALFVEGQLDKDDGGSACGWAHYRNSPGWLVILIDNCDIRPLQGSVWPLRCDIPDWHTNSPTYSALFPPAPRTTAITDTSLTTGGTCSIRALNRGTGTTSSSIRATTTTTTMGATTALTSSTVLFLAVTEPASARRTIGYRLSGWSPGSGW